MTEAEYAEEVRFQRNLGRAQVTLLLMQLRLDVFRRGPVAPTVSLNADRLRAENKVTWTLVHPDRMAWDEAEWLRPLVEGLELVEA